MFGSERSSETCIAYLHFIFLHKIHHIISNTIFSPVFIVKFLNHLNLLNHGKTRIILDLGDSSFHLFFLIFHFLFFFLSFRNASGSNNSNTNISSSKSTHIIGTITCIKDTSSCKLFYFLHNVLFILRRCSCKYCDFWVKQRV